MANRLAESTWNQQNFREFLHSLSPENKTLVCIKEKHNKKLNKSTLSVLFNETCIKEGLLPKYTTIYIYFPKIWNL